MYHTNMRFRVACIAFVAVVSGCTMGPDYVRPQLDLMSNYSEPSPTGESIANLEWWNIFKDPTLQALIRRALEQNKDLQAATARVEAAAAMVGISRSELYPQVSIGGTGSRLDLSNRILNFDPRPRNVFGLVGNISYELDLWGKISRSNESEKAKLLGTEYARNALTISLISSVARSYMTILSLDKQLSVAERTFKSRKGTTTLINARLEKGIVPELDLNQAQFEEEDAAISIVQLKRAKRVNENALSVLLGTNHLDLPISGSIDAQVLIDQLPKGFPAALLERRPDVQAAEQSLRSATALIGVAKAERLPSLDLGGMIAFQGRHLNQVFEQDSFAWRYGAEIAGPLLDFGRGLSRVEAAEASALEALKHYEKTVLEAVKEVEDASVAVATYFDEYQAILRQIKAAANAARLSHARYNDGVTNYLELLEVERSLFRAELASASARENYLNSIIKLYGALGGGWKDEGAP